MPNYKITIMDKDVKGVHNDIERNLREFEKSLDESKKSAAAKVALKMLSKKGITSAFIFNWKWNSESRLSLEYNSVMPLNNKAYNDVVKKLAELGKMQIERVREEDEKEKENIVLVKG